MENIGNFLDACVAYGVPKTDLFQTVDLFEAQNIPQVSMWKSVILWFPWWIQVLRHTIRVY